jgi:hypothetical protein
MAMKGVEEILINKQTNISASAQQEQWCCPEPV